MNVIEIGRFQVTGSDGTRFRGICARNSWHAIEIAMGLDDLPYGLETDDASEWNAEPDESLIEGLR